MRSTNNAAEIYHVMYLNAHLRGDFLRIAAFAFEDGRCGNFGYRSAAKAASSGAVRAMGIFNEI